MQYYKVKPKYSQYQCGARWKNTHLVAHYAANNDAIGAPVSFDSLNTDVQNYIKSLL